MNKILFLVFILAIALGFIISHSFFLELKNKELQETVIRQEKAIKSLENQMHPNIPQYLDSIPDYE